MLCPSFPLFFLLQNLTLSVIMSRVSGEEGRDGHLPRFFLPSDAIGADTLTLTGENARHAKVLRLQCGDAVTVCDGAGTDVSCTVQAISGECVTLSILSRAPSSSEPATACSVYVGFPKADKLEHIIQKATELGAAEIVAFPSSRCVSRPDAKSLPKKLERWQKIAAAAAEQSGRGRIPAVLIMDSFESALSRAASAELALLPYENERACSIRAALCGASPKTVSVMTGPEGGFSEEEIRLARHFQMKICTLGPRILRCETAPLCALTAVLFACGALD